MIELEAALTGRMIVSDCALCGQAVELTNGWAVRKDGYIISNICGLCQDKDTVDLIKLEATIAMSLNPEWQSAAKRR